MLRKIEISELGSIEKQWNALAWDVFQSFDWIDTYIKTLAADKEPLILVEETKGIITGIAPLMISQKRFYRIIEFIGSPMSDYSNVLARDKKDFLSKVFQYLKKNLNYLDVINLTEIPCESDTIISSREIVEKIGLHMFVQKANECYFLDIKSCENPKKFCDSRHIRKQIRKLEKIGHLKFFRCIHKDYKRIFKIMREQHIALWNDRGFRSMFEDEGHVQFFDRFLNKNLGKNTELWVLNIDDKPIAIALGFLSHNSFLGFCHSIDIHYRKYSPGRILLKFLMENYIDEGLSTIDMLRGAEQYKKRFTNSVTINCNMFITKSRVLYLLAWFHGQIRHHIINYPKLHNLLLKYKQRFSLYF